MAKIADNRIIILSILVFAVVTVVTVAIALVPERIVGSTKYDFENDDLLETVRIRNRRLEVLQNQKLIFKSQEGYEVNDFDIGDIDNDGKVELVFGFWRYGDFAKDDVLQPNRRDPKKSYHVNIYKYSQIRNNFYLSWGSSTLPHPIFDFAIIEKDGRNILEVVEGSYEDYDKSEEIKPIENSYWVWDEWWFEEYSR